MATESSTGLLLEAALVAKALKLLRAAGAKVEKQHGGAFSRTGEVDLVGCLYGYYFGLEFKRSEAEARTHVTPAQRRTLADIRAAGGYAAIVWKLSQVTTMIATLDDLALRVSSIFEDSMRPADHTPTAQLEARMERALQHAQR